MCRLFGCCKRDAMRTVLERLFGCPGHMSGPFNEFARYHKLRCGCDDCVAIAKKFVNVNFPTIVASNSLGNKAEWKAASDARHHRRVCEYGEYREVAKLPNELLLP
jgi:hypothetical protein